jgi:hypothetical protein
MTSIHQTQFLDFEADFDSPQAIAAYDELPLGRRCSAFSCSSMFR